MTLLLFSLEIAIALFLDSGFIRYTFGDVLASILVYTSFRSFLVLRPKVAAVISLGISFFLEGLQFMHFIALIHQEHNVFLNVVLGNHFSIGDLIAYSVGVIIIYSIDKKFIYESC